MIAGTNRINPCDSRKLYLGYRDFVQQPAARSFKGHGNLGIWLESDSLPVVGRSLPALVGRWDFGYSTVRNVLRVYSIELVGFVS